MPKAPLRSPRLTPRLSSLLALASLAGLVVGTAGCGHKQPTNLNPLASIKSSQPDKVLYDIAMQDLAKDKFTVARLNLETLLNTYPDSEYLARAKMAVADSWYREGGVEGMAQAEAQYKDFITFFPDMKEASEAQLKIATIHYLRLQKPDRDPTEALRAQAELRTFLLNYPDSPLRDKAVQMLRDTQEILAERDYRIAAFYLQRAQMGSYSDYRPAQSRLEETLAKFPLYSRGDVALDQLANAYMTTSKLYAGAASFEQNPPTKALYQANADTDKQKAIADFTQEIERYPLSPLTKDAARNLTALEQPVPKPTAEAVAFNKQEIAGHLKPPSDMGWKYGFGFDTIVTGKPRTELARADKVGQPSLNEPPSPPAEPPPGLEAMLNTTLKALGDASAMAQIDASLTGTGAGAGNAAAASATGVSNNVTATTAPSDPKAAAPLAFQNVPDKPRGADTPDTGTPQAVTGNNENDPNARQAQAASNPNVVLTPNELDLETQEQIVAADIHRQVPPPVRDLRKNAELQAKQREAMLKKIKAQPQAAANANGKPAVTNPTAPNAAVPPPPDAPNVSKKAWYHIW